MTAQLGFKRKCPPLLHPNSISQLLKAARKGHVVLPEIDRLTVARHRQGARGHETQGFAR